MMIERPSVLMINCLGSYFVSIIDSLSGKKNLALNYLRTGVLTYNSLDDSKSGFAIGKNAWNYQPINITDPCGDAMQINIDYYSYLKRRNNIDVNLVNAEDVGFITALEYTKEDYHYFICTVDEYYMRHSRFYMNNHNKHCVLLKNINWESSIAEIVDSELHRICCISLKELEEAIYKSVYKRKTIYYVNGTRYQDEDYSNDFLIRKNATDKSYLHHFLKDMDKRKSRTYAEERYYYQGYYYNIISKIIPYLQMASNNTKSCSERCCSDFDRELKQWRNVAGFMRFKIEKNDVNLTALIEKIQNSNWIMKNITDKR